MARFQYYFSRDPGTLSPPTGELLSIEADSLTDAVEKIRAIGGVPPDWPSIWVHILTWANINGEHRGFESTQLR